LESGYPREVKNAMAGRAAISLEPTPGGGASLQRESAARTQLAFDCSNSQAQPARRIPGARVYIEGGRAVLRPLMKASTRVRRLCIDRHGIGMNLAENLRTEFRSRVEGIALVGQVKESLAVGLKIAFENEAIAIPRDRELTAQIHSIKKMATDAGYARFDTEKNERHHADKFWALSLSVRGSESTFKRPKRLKGVQASVI